MDMFKDILGGLGGIASDFRGIVETFGAKPNVEVQGARVFTSPPSVPSASGGPDMNMVLLAGAVVLAAAMFMRK